MQWLPLSTCIALSPRLSPGVCFACALASVSMLKVGAAEWNFLVPRACPWEILFNLGLLLELNHISSQLGVEHAVKTAFSAALCFYLLQQNDRWDWWKPVTLLLTEATKASQWHHHDIIISSDIVKRALVFSRIENKKSNWRSSNKTDIYMESSGSGWTPEGSA